MTSCIPPPLFSSTTFRYISMTKSFNIHETKISHHNSYLFVSLVFSNTNILVFTNYWLCPRLKGKQITKGEDVRHPFL